MSKIVEFLGILRISNMGAGLTSYLGIFVPRVSRDAGDARDFV